MLLLITKSFSPSLKTGILQSSQGLGFFAKELTRIELPQFQLFNLEPFIGRTTFLMQ